MKTMLWVTVLGLLTLAVPHAGAQDLSTVQARMKERLAQIAPLKTQKVVGEDRDGFLALLKTDADAAAREVVQAENADRKMAYAGIAARTGADPAQVGRQRAKELAQRSAPGMMLQADDGSWYEKK